MEEILASIRRIIEESDTTRTDAVPPPAVNSDAPTASGRTERQVSDEAALPPREGIAVARPLPSADPSFEATLRRPQMPFAPTPDEGINEEAFQPVEAEQPSIDVSETLAQAPAFLGEEPVVISADATPMPEMSLEQAHALLLDPPLAADVQQPAPTPEPVGMSSHLVTEAPAGIQADTRNETMDDDASFQLEQALEPIVSEATEREVSSAFEDLSFAVRNEQRRSFDEIAQEIMRPLLQEWLDNNLPTLVERLVREEIERVARGGRR